MNSSSTITISTAGNNSERVYKVTFGNNETMLVSESNLSRAASEKEGIVKIKLTKQVIYNRNQHPTFTFPNQPTITPFIT